VVERKRVPWRLGHCVGGRERERERERERCGGDWFGNRTIGPCASFCLPNCKKTIDMWATPLSRFDLEMVRCG
jgi:hypothetical protein